MIYQRAEQKGSGAATDFLASSWLRRIWVLFPASHPWLEAKIFSLMRLNEHSYNDNDIDIP